MFALGCLQSLDCNKNTCSTGITPHDRRQQMGLDPADKAVRVANYCRNLHHDVEMIAHSCGVPHLRRLRRFHVRIVGPDGASRAGPNLSIQRPHRFRAIDRLAERWVLAARTRCGAL
jgi:hypothetical protein